MNMYESIDMKITATFNDEEEAIKAIHSGYAWQALHEINEILRQQRKHDLPYEQAVLQIQASVQDALAMIYPN
jgi:hypothetical protein